MRMRAQVKSDISYSKSKRIKNQIKEVVTNPYNVIVLIAIILLTYLIVLPLLDMISSTFILAQRDARSAGGMTGDFTLYYWHRLLASELTSKLLLEPLLNSLLIGVCVSVLAITIGSVLAWLMVRTDLPFKKFFSLAVIIPYMIPSWCKSQAWLTMFKTERIGGAPGFLIIAFHVLRHIIMQHEADVGFVDPHAERVGGYHHRRFVVGESLLVFPAFFVGKPRVIAGGRKAVPV